MQRCYKGTQEATDLHTELIKDRGARLLQGFYQVKGGVLALSVNPAVA